MKKVIYCWELGANYGHITGFMPFYRELIKSGANVSFVIRDLGFAHQLLGDENVIYFQAPLPKDEASGVAVTFTYTDLLAQIGYLNPDRLIAHVNAWRNLLKLLNAEVIVADHAPTAILAAKTLGIPVAIFGDGFSMPPADNPMPIFHVWENVPDLAAHQYNYPVLNSINHTLTHFGKAPLEAICDLFNCEERFLCTTPELDHYFDRGIAEYWGPRFIDDVGTEPQWPCGDGSFIFAYLTTQIKSLDKLIEAISQIPGNKIIHIPRVSTEITARYQRADLIIERAQINMKAVFTKADLVIHQSGAGTASACLLAGKRQLLVPTQLEQRMLCKKLVSQGLAYGIDPDSLAPQYVDVIKDALSCPHLGRNLQVFRQKYSGFDQQEQFSAMAEVVCEM